MQNRSNDYKASKWLYQRCLLSREGLGALLDHLKYPHLIATGRLLQESDIVLSPHKLLDNYGGYVNSLEGGEKISLDPLFITADKAAIEVLQVKEGQYLTKPSKPLIQISEHQFILGANGELHSMVYGREVIRWGIQFAYPSLYIDPATKQVVEVLKEEQLLNTPLFKELQRWMRYNTKPVAFQARGKKVQATFRIGLDMQNMIHNDLTLNQLCL